ncbi:hypothetical protein F5B20DRAFT_281897 [Whalleya microplaca]|nr:hypothetical protein F5B20DRAFT_281897 [Whalleya microplaca]
MAEVPVVQILDKKNYFKQALVSLPDAVPLSPLGSNSLRIRTVVLSLTINNFTYARLGDYAHWWDVHPIPPSTPAPYNDASIYGRINCWGYAIVLESTFPDVPAGSYLFGYLPIGTLPQDIEVKAANVPGQVIVTNAFRQHLMSIYNRYTVHPPTLSADIESKSDAIAFDSLIRIMHITAYLMADFVFSPDPKASTQLTPDLADLTGATVINFAPGSKVGLAFAHRLRTGGRTGGKPALLLGATSAASPDFVKDTNLYDAVALTSENPLAVLAALQTDTNSRVLICDFGGRAGVATKWAAAIKSAYANCQLVRVGLEVVDPSAAGPPPAYPEGLQVIQVSADGMQNDAIKKVGEREYFAGLDAAWEDLRKEGYKGFKVSWGEGMVDVRDGWDKLARGEARSDEGLVFKV